MAITHEHVQRLLVFSYGKYIRSVFCYHCYCDRLHCLYRLNGSVCTCCDIFFEWELIFTESAAPRSSVCAGINAPVADIIAIFLYCGYLDDHISLKIPGNKVFIIKKR
jgi:hypothetical protein